MTSTTWRVRGRAIGVSAMAMALVAAGCSGGDGDRPGPSPSAERGGVPQSLVGFVIAGDPVEGATVTAVDGDGRTIATSTDPSLASGVWTLELRDPPESFTLVATGGREHGRAFEGELVSVVRGYDHLEPSA